MSSLDDRIRPRLGLWLCAALCLAPSAAAAQTTTASVASAAPASVSPTATATAAARSRGLVRDVRPEHPEQIDPLRTVLELPGQILELAFTPLMPLAMALERLHLLSRLIELLTNDEKTIAFVPVIDPFNSSGLGIGGSLIYNEPLGSADRLVLLGLIRTNRDRNFSVSFSRRIPALSGRTISAGAFYSADHDTRYFGIGQERTQDDLRIIRTDAVNVRLGTTLLNPARLPEYDASVEIAYRRRRLGVGSGSRAVPLVENDSIPLPPAFGDVLDYPELTLAASYDSRDSLGRTTRGSVASVQVIGTRDINGGKTSALRTTARFATFLPVLPLFRTLVLSVGASAAIPIARGDQVPLHQLVNLGGASTLRGYVDDRFLDRLGWWATAEYRFRFYEYAGSSMQLSAAVFADVGKVGREPRDLVQGTLPWSVGINLRAEQNLVLLGRVQLGFSPDGFRFSVGFGELF